VARSDSDLEARLRTALGGDALVAAPDDLADTVRSRHRRQRLSQLAVTAGSLALVTIIVTATAFVGSRDVSAPESPLSAPPALVTGVPVWYDAAGLHRGDQVVQTAVKLFQARGEILSVLALVRTGALYVDPVKHDVWFQPWNGRPRVVGQHSLSGPGGDRQGDVAAWFEGDELVVYDTARGAEISRTTQAPVLDHAFREYVGGYEHVVGNGFMHVSAEEVVWRSEAGTHRLDVATGTSRLLRQGPPTANPRLEDVDNGTRVWGDYRTSALTVEIGGRRGAPLRGLEPIGRLSADGSFVMAPWKTAESLGVAFVDVRTGKSWHVTGNDWNAWTSWSYGDVAVLHVERGTAGPDLELLACDAVKHVCERLPEHGPDLILPSS
jgi:hypothetical protein